MFSSLTSWVLTWKTSSTSAAASSASRLFAWQRSKWLVFFRSQDTWASCALPAPEYPSGSSADHQALPSLNFLALTHFSHRTDHPCTIDPRQIFDLS